MKLPEVDCMNEEQRNNVIRNMTIGRTKAARQCERIKPNGEFCGSLALHGRKGAAGRKQGCSGGRAS
jgi:hypothetical protein